MSGLVTTTWPAARIAERIGAGRVAVVGRGDDRQPGRGRQLAELGRPGPGRAPWSGTGTAPGPPGPRRWPAGPAARSTASCPRRSGSRRRRPRRRGPPRSPRPGGVYSCSMPRAREAARRCAGRASPASARTTASAAGMHGVVDDAAGERRLLEQAGQDGRRRRRGHRCASRVSADRTERTVRNGRQSSATRGMPRVTGRLSRPTWLTRSYGVATLPPMFRRLRPSAARRRPRRTTDEARPTSSDARRPRARGSRAPDLARPADRRHHPPPDGRASSARIARRLDRHRLRPPGRRGLGRHRRAADDIATDNARLQHQVAALERELDLIGASALRRAAGARLRPRGVARDRVHASPPTRPPLAAGRPGLGRRPARCRSDGCQPARALADRPVRPRGVAARSRRPASARSVMQVQRGVHGPACGRRPPGAYADAPSAVERSEPDA